MKRILSSLWLAGGILTAADLSYVERTQVTDGAIVRMTAMLGRLAKGVTDPITTTHSYSANKKASVSPKSHEIWDLSTETITSINAADKEYSVITFAEMAQMATAMAERMSQQRGAAQPNAAATAKWNASFEKNDQTKQVAGVETHGGTLKLEMEATDTKSGQTGAMKMDIQMWMGKIPGWEVKRDFDRKTGEKFGAQVGPQMQALAQAGPAALEAMKEAGKKIAEMGEMQLSSVTRMYSDSMPNLPADSGSTPSSSQPAPNAGQVASEEAARQAEYEAARRAGGRFGGLGGGLGGRLGGKLGQMGKKPQPTTESQPQPASSSQPAPAAASGPGVLAEFTTEVVSYSNSVDLSVFQVPAGFKQVEHPMKKAFGKYANK
jgi:hypothetical protein